MSLYFWAKKWMNWLRYKLLVILCLYFEGPGVGGDYGPYRQSERNSLYKQHAEKLLDSGYVYRCFCSNGVVGIKLWSLCWYYLWVMTLE